MSETAVEKKAAPQVQTITMDDGRVVDFVGKRRMLKSTIIENNEVSVRMDFVNGETRLYKVTPELLLKFAGHGAEQKLGDEIAGVEDTDDAVEAIDELMVRLSKGEWTVTRAKGQGIAGASILVRALVELTGKPVAAIRDSLASKTQEEKLALRRNSKLQPIVARLEAEKNSRKEKKVGVDSEALLDSMLADVANPSIIAGQAAETTEAA